MPASVLQIAALFPDRKDSRKHLRTLHPHALQTRWIQTQRLQDGRSNLTGLYRRRKRLGLQARIRHQDHHVGVVVGEAAVLGLLLGASGIN